jgi:hypothetical protein
MVWLAYFTFAIIVIYPNCEYAINFILDQLEGLFPIYLIFLIVISTINFLIERKLEKKNSKVFLFLFVFHSMVLLLVILYCSIDFHNHCGEIT